MAATMTEINPQDWHPAWPPCPPGYEGRWQQFHDIRLRILEMDEQGFMPVHIVGAVAAELGFVPRPTVDQLQAELKGEKEKNQRQHDSIVMLQDTVQKEREAVPFDHLEREDRRRIEKKAYDDAVEYLQSRHWQRRTKAPETSPVPSSDPAAAVSEAVESLVVFSADEVSRDCQQPTDQHECGGLRATRLVGWPTAHRAA